MMRGSTTVFTVKNVAESMAYYRDKLGFDAAVKRGAKVLKEPEDYDYGRRDFYFGMESKKDRME